MVSEPLAWRSKQLNVTVFQMIETVQLRACLTVGPRAIKLRRALTYFFESNIHVV